MPKEAYPGKLALNGDGVGELGRGRCKGLSGLVEEPVKENALKRHEVFWQPEAQRRRM